MKSSIISFILVVAISCQPDDCVHKLDLGTACSTAKSGIRYHLDKSTNLCMAFTYTGCGGNKNNFEDQTTCELRCLPTGIVGCPANSEPVTGANGKQTCKSDADCGKTGYCRTRLTGGGLCCKADVRDKINADYKSKCAAGKSVVKVDGEVLIGKSCKSNFCPTGAECKEGNYFATCCK